MQREFLMLGAALAVFAQPAFAGELTLKERAAARKVYVAKCAKCHKFYEPRNYSEADWGLWMDKMSRKSKLSAEQEALLKRYLNAYRAGQIEKAR
jgi:cytochrome c553